MLLPAPREDAPSAKVDRVAPAALDLSVEAVSSPAALLAPAADFEDSPCKPARLGGARVPRTPTSPWSDSAWGDAIPDIAGGWRRHSFGAASMAPAFEGDEESASEADAATRRPEDGEGALGEQEADSTGRLPPPASWIDGCAVPDIAGGWRRDSLGVALMDPPLEGAEEEVGQKAASETDVSEGGALRNRNVGESCSTEGGEEEQEEREEAGNAGDLSPLDDLHCVPQPGQSWEFPLSKSEKSLLLNRLCDQERASVVRRYNNLVRRVSFGGGPFADDDESEQDCHENDNGEEEEEEEEDEEEKRLKLKQQDLEKELERVRNERRRLSSSRRLSY